jgi:hypothetical protein
VSSLFLPITLVDLVLASPPALTDAVLAEEVCVVYVP